MDFIFYYNANVIKLLVVIFSLTLTSLKLTAQEDPISQAIESEKQEYLGAKFKKNEAEELNHINEKYALNDKEVELRSKQRSGQKIGLIDKFRLGRANRKDYLRNKKFEEFKKNKVLKSQSEKTKIRMLENKKKADNRYKKQKQKTKTKSFFKLFK